MTPKWFEIALDVLSENAEAASALLAAEGFAGCEVREGPVVTRLVVFAEAGDGEAAEARASAARAAISSLLVGEPQRGQLAPNLAPCPAATELDPAVWTDNWRRHFTKRTFAGRVEVLPPWEKPSPAEAGLLSIVINPGMAFGTGLHETTASCMELLVEHIRPGDTVADIGCGSGILALAALSLGAASARASDIDPLAVDATLENAASNHLESRLRAVLEDASTPIESASGAAASGEDASTAPPAAETFDVVVANILAETLIELRERLLVQVRQDGLLILSGIEASRLKMVIEAFIRPPWTQVALVEKGEWATVALRRASSSAATGADGARRQNLHNLGAAS